jgi:hypothetical protein
VTQYQPARRQAGEGSGRYVIGRFADSAQVIRASTAIRIAFIDDETIVALDNAAGDSLELRGERLAPLPSGKVRVLWRERIVGVDEPQLFIDRARPSWVVVGRGRGDRSFVVITDSLGGAKPRARELSSRSTEDVGEIMTQPLVVFSEGGAIWSTLPQLHGAAGVTPLLLALMGTPRWELRGSDSTGERFLADVDGFPTCATELNVHGTLCVERSPNGLHIWRAASARTLARVADLPPTLDVIHAEAGDQIAAAERFGQRVVALDAATRQAVRLTLPTGASARPGARWTADVAARGGYLLVLSTGRDGATVTRYAIR